MTKNLKNISLKSLSFACLPLATASTFIGYILFFTILFFLFFFAATIDFQVPYTAYCQGAEEVTLDNNYWKIENIAPNVWHVLFRNVGVKYEIRQTVKETDVNTCSFEYREIGPNYPGLFADESIILHLTWEESLAYWDKNNQGYEPSEDAGGAPGGVYLRGSADRKYVFTFARHSDIVDATMEHFNDIQRGKFHPDLKNKINPNSHGKNANVLNNIPNTFGLNDSKIWPNNQNLKSSNLSSKSSNTFK